MVRPCAFVTCLFVIAACNDSTTTNTATIPIGSSSTAYETTTMEESSTGAPTSTAVVPTEVTDSTGVGPACSNGVVEPGEACDDGNSNDHDACTNACMSAECGDGIVGPSEVCDDGAANGSGMPCDEFCQPMAVCGNGTSDPGEQCDDGPANADTNSCTADCTDNVCGDGKVGPGEGCDDGNAIEDDGCTNACALASCGDSVVAPTEQCDDGNDDNEDSCTNACTAPTCGDGFVQAVASEQCDDGPDNANDAACTNSCQTAICGDGHVWGAGGEACDSGAENGPGKQCNAQCQLNACGDGDPGPDEQCDDGNLDAGDGCSGTCELEGCGNDKLDPGEQCDDGKDGDNDDGCTDACKLPTCGDGLVQPSLAEQCDQGGANSNSGTCTLACKTAACGDGLVHGVVEQCDDGVDNGPGKQCKANCQLNVCGDGDKGPGETCDDGNPSNLDACTSACKLAVCGDGFVQPGAGEVCDDGNTANGDTCSADCSQETKVLHVYAGTLTSCAIVSGGRVKCWGYNGQGGLGLGDTAVRGDNPGEMGAALPFIDLGAGKSAVQLALSSGSTCALLTDGTIKCWGGSLQGQLGLGDTTARGDNPGEMGNNLPVLDLGAGAKAVQLHSGIEHLCAHLDTGTVKCWGFNSGGQLGQGDTNSRGDMPGEMGNALLPLKFGAAKQVALLEAGLNHGCVRFTDNTVKCWGWNDAGQLGIGDKNFRGDAGGEMADALPLVPLPAGKLVGEFALGIGHSCARFTDLSVACWGAAVWGIIGQGPIDNIGDGPGEMGNSLPMVDLGDLAISITAGHSHTCARLQAGGVKCWGHNDFGQLGLGDTADRGDQLGEMGGALPFVDIAPGHQIVELSAGNRHNCALLEDGSVRCWGRGLYGILGLGNSHDRGDGPGEMGANLPPVPIL